MARSKKNPAAPALVVAIAWNLATGAHHRAALAAERNRARLGCEGKRYYWSFDTDYPCSGCAACDPCRSLGHALKTAGELESRTWARALSAVGAAVAAALLPGLALESLIASSVVAWNTVEKGRWFMVTGARGRAKEFQGQVGVVKWIGTEERRSQYGTWSYGSTTRAGLQIAGREKLAYVSVGNLSPVAEPTEAKAERLAREAAKVEKAAAASVRPRYRGMGAVVVLTGEHAGRAGRTFWRGPSKREQGAWTVGVKFCSCKKRCECPVAWLDDRDVASPTATDLEPIELREGFTVTGVVSPAEQAELLVLALAAVGADEAAAEWAKVAS